MNAVKRAAEKAQEARRNVQRTVHGYDTAVELLMVALATGGHTLLEGVPGVGKTTLAKAFSASSGLLFRRVQLTPDLMPSDITGHTFFNQATGAFEMRQGPVFTNILLADEINRAPPRTQSSLLEVMEEGQVTIEGETLKVADPFLVIATKNPIDIEGVYPLPEAQLDRFMLFIEMGYPDRDVEKDMLLGKLGRREGILPMPELADILREGYAKVKAHPDVVGYILDIVRATREQPGTVELGAGPRATAHLLAASRAAALLEGRDYVVPDDVKRMAPHVLSHRLMLTADADIAGVRKRDIVLRILDEVPVPVEVAEAR